MINIKQQFLRYYVAVRPRTNEFHHIHKEGCPFMPEKEMRIYLGSFISGNDALLEGTSYFKRSECCSFCLKDQNKEKRKFDFAEVEYAIKIPGTVTIEASYEYAFFSISN